MDSTMVFQRGDLWRRKRKIVGPLSGHEVLHKGIQFGHKFLLVQKKCLFR